MKSKLTAKEKHLQEKIIKLQQQINKLEQNNSQYIRDNYKIKEENRNLQKVNLQQKEQIDKLLEYTELTKEDIKIACEKDKGLAKMYGMINGMGESGILRGMF